MKVGAIIGGLLTLLLLGVVLSSRTKPQTEDRYPCDSDASTPVSKVGDFIAEIYPARPDQYDRPAEKGKIGTPTFRINELNNEGKPKEAMFFSITRPNRQIVINIAAKLQICDADNMMDGTTGILKDNPVLLDRTDNLAYYLHLYQGNVPLKPGNYRLDGYIYSGGTWALVARFPDVILTE